MGEEKQKEKRKIRMTLPCKTLVLGGEEEILLVQDIEKLSIEGKMPKLEDITLRVKTLEGASGLEMAPNLKRLDFSHSNISSIDSLGGIEKLQKLDTLVLRFNKLTNVNGLGKIPNIKNLYLDRNKISEIDEGYLPNIESLNISWNMVTDLKNLNFANMPNLKYLDISWNGIDRKEDLDEFNYHERDLGGVPIIEGLEQLSSLEHFVNYSNYTTKYITKASYEFLRDNNVKIEGRRICKLEII